MCSHAVTNGCQAPKKACSLSSFLGLNRDESCGKCMHLICFNKFNTTSISNRGIAQEQIMSCLCFTKKGSVIGKHVLRHCLLGCCEKKNRMLQRVETLTSDRERSAGVLMAQWHQSAVVRSHICQLCGKRFLQSYAKLDRMINLSALSRSDVHSLHWYLHRIERICDILKLMALWLYEPSA